MCCAREEVQHLHVRVQEALLGGKTCWAYELDDPDGLFIQKSIRNL